MDAYKETELKQHIKEHGSITVDIVNDETGISYDKTYDNIDEALNDIRVLEIEHTIYF